MRIASSYEISLLLMDTRCILKSFGDQQRDNTGFLYVFSLHMLLDCSSQCSMGSHEVIIMHKERELCHCGDELDNADTLPGQCTGEKIEEPWLFKHFL